MKRTLITSALSLALGAMLALPVGAQEVLPFPPKPSGSIAAPTMQESTYSPLPAVNRLPKDAPNILIVLIDDVGPAQADTYGGEIRTPTLSRIAKEGISYNRFHTTAMCSPTRSTHARTTTRRAILVSTSPAGGARNAKGTATRRSTCSFWPTST